MQTARGASLNDSVAESQPDPARARRVRALRLFATIALLGYVVDLVTKTLAVDRLTGRPPVHVVGDLLTLTLVRNPGAAFSTGTSYTIVLTFVAVAAVVAVLWFARRLGSTGWAVALGFLLAGVLGNLTDRIFREPAPLHGHVVDFLRLPHWPIFNVADICINIAAAVVVLQAVRGIPMVGRSPEHADRERSGPDGPGEEPTP